ncbi:DUF711 family protein [Candidatus Riflebacteria bacterium]
MKKNKIIRSLCYFAEKPDEKIIEKLDVAQKKLLNHRYSIQTRRVCFADTSVNIADAWASDKSLLASVGSLERKKASTQLDNFLHAADISFSLDLTSGVEREDVDLLFRIIQCSPEKTFNFAFTFSNSPSSPYFPSATFEKEGFGIGLQPLDLSDGCTILEDWLQNMKFVWNEINYIFTDEPEFLGIDSSVASLYSGNSSLVHFVKKITGTFSKSVTTDIYLRITDFIKKENPVPLGLCGLMLPCLEDFELADEYAAGNFPIERNLFLAMHSGPGIDTYPIGINESRDRVYEILSLLQKLSAKYGKSLAARFVSDGKAKIGEKTCFKNKFLKDVVVREL